VLELALVAEGVAAVGFVRAGAIVRPFALLDGHG